jgi:ABC-type branched-subunit amino acid transport system substrate-binding protein
MDACEAQAGFEFVQESPAPFGETDWSTYVSEMKSKGVEYFSMVSASSETLAVLEEMNKQDVAPEVIDLGQQYYDPAISDAEVADGAYVLTNTFPFFEAEDIPALQLYVDLMEESDSGDIVSSLGVQAFSAALLWATATKALGNDLSRQSLLDELATIKEWDGGGLHPPTNPGDHEIQACFLYLRVSEKEFVREYPEEGSDCDDAYIYESDERFE